jgi:hypothetical protein
MKELFYLCSPQDLTMANIQVLARQISSDNNADLFIYTGRIDDNNADSLINEIRSLTDKKENCALILTTMGGDPDAGYRIVRCIHQYYKKFILYVFGFCKSTGTLIALGADKIVMGDLAEFGPLDIQLTQGDELSGISGLNYLQCLVSLNERLYSSFESNFGELKGFGITTKTAAEIASKLAVGILEPIAAQIDPVKLGEVQRVIKIGSAYGERITKDDSDVIRKLIGDYPSHSFVIDFKEMKELFKNNSKKEVRRPTAEEYGIEREFKNLVRKPDKKPFIFALNFPPEPQNNNNENIQQTQQQQQQQHEGNVPVAQPAENGHGA